MEQLTGATPSPTLNPPGGGEDHKPRVPTVIKPAKVKASVVESVVTQLQGGLFGKCMRTVVSVSNYTVGDKLRRIRFTLELEHLNDVDDSCEKKNKEKERCSVKVKTVNGHTVILWDSTSCSRDRGCNACGVERDDKVRVTQGVTANDDYDPTIVGEDSNDVNKGSISQASEGLESKLNFGLNHGDLIDGRVQS